MISFDLALGSIIPFCNAGFGFIVIQDFYLLLKEKEEKGMVHYAYRLNRYFFLKKKNGIIHIILSELFTWFLYTFFNPLFRIMSRLLSTPFSLCFALV
jgi:hypothetical protein